VSPGDARRLLLVTFHFPPDAEVGGLRAQKFVKYLPQFGWHPHVLTTHERHYASHDHSRLTDIASARIERTSMIIDPATAFLRSRARLAPWVGCREARGGGLAVATPAKAGALATAPPPAGFRRAAIMLARAPDPQIGWLPPAVVRALRLWRRDGFDAMLTSGPPHTCHLIGLCLKRLTGVPWAAEFRDPWVGNPWGGATSTPTVRALDRVLERRTIRAADRVITTNEVQRDALQARYPEYPAFVVIPNGFDADDFSKVPEPSPPGRFTIVYVGTFDGRRSAGNCLRAIAALIGAGRISTDDVHVALVGAQSAAGLAMAPEIARVLAPVLEFVGAVPYTEALAWMRRAHVLLLLAQNQPEQVPAKAFEYLAMGGSILAVTGEGATASLMHETGGTVVPDQVEPIKAAIEARYAAFRGGGQPAAATPWRRPALARFDRRQLTRTLVGVLDDMIQRG
jgi:glycosyltransferase involved in cell wall biosynthesis